MITNHREPQVMAILNVTPDSFYGGSRTEHLDQISHRVRTAIEAGASILDIGGYSSRPDAEDVPLETEWERVERALSVVREISADVQVSVDTFRSQIVERAVESFGRIIVNDISAGEIDPRMWSVVAGNDLDYVAMHMRGTPQTMQSMTQYDSGVVSDVVNYFEQRLEQMAKVGVHRVIVDPGFGFAKSLEQNFELLAGLDRLVQLGQPVLVGLSRKSMIYKTLGVGSEQALAGSLMLGWEAMRKGATILRVHDVAEAMDGVRLFKKYSECK